MHRGRLPVLAGGNRRSVGVPLNLASRINTCHQRHQHIADLPADHADWRWLLAWACNHAAWPQLRCIHHQTAQTGDGQLLRGLTELGPMQKELFAAISLPVPTPVEVRPAVEAPTAVSL